MWVKQKDRNRSVGRARPRPAGSRTRPRGEDWPREAGTPPRAEAGARWLFLFLLRRVTPLFPVLGEPEAAWVKELLNWTHVRLQAQIPAGPCPARGEQEAGFCRTLFSKAPFLRRPRQEAGRA